MNRPDIEAANACAVPENPVLSVWGGSMPATVSLMRLTASPSEAPGRRLKEIVTDGSCPEWFTLSGPTDRPSVATAAKGTSRCCEDVAPDVGVDVVPDD